MRVRALYAGERLRHLGRKRCTLEQNDTFYKKMMMKEPRFTKRDHVVTERPSCNGYAGC
jgi:hypothetical protein